MSRYGSFAKLLSGKVVVCTVTGQRGDTVATEEIEANPKSSSKVAISPCGTWFAASEWDGRLVLIDLANRRVTEHPCYKKVHRVAFPNESVLLIGSESGMRAWPVPGGSFRSAKKLLTSAELRGMSSNLVIVVKGDLLCTYRFGTGRITVLGKMKGTILASDVSACGSAYAYSCVASPLLWIGDVGSDSPVQPRKVELPAALGHAVDIKLGESGIIAVYYDFKNGDGISVVSLTREGEIVFCEKYIEGLTLPTYISPDSAVIFSKDLVLTILPREGILNTVHI